MGRTVCEAVASADDMELAGQADPQLAVGLEELLEREHADVAVDFSQPEAAIENGLACVARACTR